MIFEQLVWSFSRIKPLKQKSFYSVASLLNENLFEEEQLNKLLKYLAYPVR
jgi:hypothetical protein